MRTIAPTRLALLALLALLAATTARAQPVLREEPAKPDAPSKLDHERIGKEYAARLGLDASKSETHTLENVYAKHFVHAELGAFHIQWPVFALPSHAGEFKDCCEALVKAQETWLDWVQLKPSDVKALRTDLGLVLKWVHGWSEGQISKGKGGQDVLQIVAPAASTLEASKRFDEAMRNLTLVGPPREKPAVVNLVFAPSRQDFTEFVYFAGLLLPDSRPALWLDVVPDWAQATVLDAQVISIQYTIAGRLPGDYKSGTWMNERDAGVMQQQVVQLAMNALFLEHYGDRMPGAFVGGLSINLVVDTYDEVNTRVDGDTRSRTAGKREVFVPGGSSEGGPLMKNSAETRWRESYGKDHFLGPLKIAQEEGGKEAKDDKNKPACFALRNDAGSAKHVVRAPFLGSAAAETKPPPDEFQGDWAEFLRAYKSGFIHWLQTAAAGNEKVSREHFATLLRKLADPKLAADFEAVFKEIYDGAPLSNAEADKSCLEGQFLRWLPKGK